MKKTFTTGVLFICSLLIAATAFAQSKAVLQKETDDKLLTEYFTKHEIHPKKTKSGLYYIITEQGTGPKAWIKQKVTVNYTGRLMLDGRIFDSNQMPDFQHTDPLLFTLGTGQVIKGWDEGFQLLNKGSKATFYIPSGLAYGEKSIGLAVPSNSILIFDVELLSIDY
ncbi:MAG: Peptidyl-prolyl cis-trans isomerase cyclophilin type [Flavipsychrobacter sp.]|nr:Peptidyl-prolyl cis-trans isomerase cyclophilin type [Flavipsychrobacter sp.]